MITSSKKKLISAVEKRIGGKISRIGIDKIENLLHIQVHLFLDYSKD